MLVRKSDWFYAIVWVVVVVVEWKGEFSAYFPFFISKLQKCCSSKKRIRRIEELCIDCFPKFRFRNFDVKDAPYSGTPVEVDKDSLKLLIDADWWVQLQHMDSSCSHGKKFMLSGGGNLFLIILTMFSRSATLLLIPVSPKVFRWRNLYFKWGHHKFYGSLFFNKVQKCYEGGIMLVPKRWIHYIKIFPHFCKKRKTNNSVVSSSLRWLRLRELSLSHQFYN